MRCGLPTLLLRRDEACRHFISNIKESGFLSHLLPQPTNVTHGYGLRSGLSRSDHDAACNDDGGRISSVGKALDCRAEGPRLYSHAEPILRVEGNSCCPANVDHDAAYDDDDDGLLPNVSTPLR